MFNYLISVRCSMFNLAMIVVLTCVPVGILYNDNYLMFVKRCSMFNRVMFNVVCVVYQYLVLFRPICHHPTLISLKSHPFICLLLFPTHSLSLFIKFSCFISANFHTARSSLQMGGVRHNLDKVNCANLTLKLLALRVIQ